MAVTIFSYRRLFRCTRLGSRGVLARGALTLILVPRLPLGKSRRGGRLVNCLVVRLLS